MKRSTPLKRKTWMKRKRAKPRRSGRVRDRDYLVRVKGLPCCLAPRVHIVTPLVVSFEEQRRMRSMEIFLGRAISTDCEGPTEADHAGERPLGRKADDSTAIPLCRKHHRERTDYTGAFRSFTAVSMRLFCDAAIAQTQQRLGYREAA